MKKETWQCVSCGNEISFVFKKPMSKNPISKECECGGFWKFKKNTITTKRRNYEIMDSINKLLGLITYEDRIKWSNANKQEMLRLEKAIKERCVKEKEKEE